MFSAWSDVHFRFTFSFSCINCITSHILQAARSNHSMEFPIQFELPQIPSSCNCFLHIFHATLVISVSLSIRFTLRDMLDKNQKKHKNKSAYPPRPVGQLQHSIVPHRCSYSIRIDEQRLAFSPSLQPCLLGRLVHCA